MYIYVCMYVCLNIHEFIIYCPKEFNVWLTKMFFVYVNCLKVSYEARMLDQPCYWSLKNAYPIRFFPVSLGNVPYPFIPDMHQTSWNNEAQSPSTLNAGKLSQHVTREGTFGERKPGSMGVRLPFRNQCSKNWKQKYIEGWIDGYLVGFSGQLQVRQVDKKHFTSERRQKTDNEGRKQETKQEMTN